MKIKIEEILNLDETEVIIKCNQADDQIKKIVSTLQMFNERLICKKNELTYSLFPNEIFYFESIDNKVFAYTSKEVFDTMYKLYELENYLKELFFIRVNKNTLVNSSKMMHFKSTINGRMEVTLKNHETIIVSRTYVSALKLILGGKTL
ncbi:MAG: LytTR family transcriptional regulator DNA-binding domain-containing protein [Firmicutes bacterium]|nr:LytTR family transcriptional regulator DNA-binding domain-containing protein [Bacillota bacterium]